MPRRTRSFPRRSPKKRRPRKYFKATCAGCGKELMLEVAPPSEKPLLCLDCFKK